MPPSPNPIILSPSTPSELLQYIISHHRYPTTVLIGWPKQTFIEGLVEDVTLHLSLQQNQPFTLQRKTLLQTAVSRHIRLLFIPSSTHLRAYLGTFSASESKIPPPILSDLDESDPRCKSETPLLLVYGFLELHRDGIEWSAQGIGTSAAYLVEAAARNSFRAAVIEPRGSKGLQLLDEFLDEKVPILSGTTIKDDGTWSGRTVPIRGVLSRWFEFEQHDENEASKSLYTCS
ncbi:hypothetical protein TrVFT333_007722 [Trichoderma virens FT-333]|nr:hypothetical protein TrVFT333_007722 [Trichoderma virens FT-333]